MADKENKVPENAEGQFYVTEDCIACGLCVEAAPLNIEMTDGESYAYVFKQPENDEERAACDTALNDCPADAIGDNG